MIDLPPPTYAQTIEAIAKCDIPPVNIRIAYQDYFQSDEVTISDLGSLTDVKLRCLKAAIHPSYILTIENQSQRAAFYEFSRREDRPREQAEGRDWLRSKGLLDKVPSFDSKRGLGAFAKALEAACGLQAGVALTANGASWLIIRPDFLSIKTFKKSGEAFWCLMQMFAASDASEQGASLGFIGNEALVDDDKK